MEEVKKKRNITRRAEWRQLKINSVLVLKYAILCYPKIVYIMMLIILRGGYT